MSRSWSSGSSSTSSKSSVQSSDSRSSIPIPSSLLKLKETIQDALQDDVSVDQFVRHVWGLPHTDTRRILDGMHNWNIPRPFLEEYKDAYGRMNENTLAARRGHNAFSAFLDVVEETLADIRTRLNDKRRPAVSVAFKCNMDNSKTKAPDIATTWDVTSKPEWSVIQTIFEFERPSGPHAFANQEMQVDDIPFQGRSSASPSSSSSRDSVRGSVSSSASASSSYATSVSSSSSRPISRRNKRRSSSDHSMTAMRSSRTEKKNRITSGELRLAQKALECMNSTGRRYMAGIYVHDCSLSLWYYDRMCAIRSRAFDLERSPGYFALVLYAITRCEVYQSGFDRFLEFPKTGFGAQLPSTTFKDSKFVIPTSSTSYCFQITREKPVYTSHELIGRGTMVYPITLQPDEDEVLVDEEEQVLKLYWPNVDDPREADVINQLHLDVPEIADHLPTISFSASFTRDALHLPSSRIKSLLGSRAEERLLHVFAMRRYEKLWEVNNIEEFQEVFLDCVECHYHAYKSGHVLHRDLSENNLMVWRPKRHSSDNHGYNHFATHGRALGILNDWDMSSRVVRYPGMASVVTMVTNDPSLAADVEALNNRTGTVPFMALDLLVEDGPVPRHLYRHDLESFLWILIWAAVHYDIPNKKNLSTSEQEIDPELKIWDEGTREDVWSCKRALLRRVGGGGSARHSSESDVEDVLDRFRPEFRKVKTEWIIPLIRMFHRAYNELRYTDVDEETCGGIVTFDTFMTAVNRKPRLVPSHNEDGWGSCIIG
ncbi:hypothetical protein APHAL10511_005740 [Amanita phalloides]|nr:hypothetical protein APHAL10511_005740 [Amanita phalloides]